MSKQRKPQRPARSDPRGPARQSADPLAQAVALMVSAVDALAGQASIAVLERGRPRRILIGYIFGMLLAYGKRERLPPATVMGAMSMLLVSKFEYGMQAADTLTRELVGATTPGTDAALHAAIYRGINGLPRWTEADQHAAVADFLAYLSTAEARSSV